MEILHSKDRKTLERVSSTSYFVFKHNLFTHLVCTSYILSLWFLFRQFWHTPYLSEVPSPLETRLRVSYSPKGSPRVLPFPTRYPLSVYWCYDDSEYRVQMLQDTLVSYSSLISTHPPVPNFFLYCELGPIFLKWSDSIPSPKSRLICKICSVSQYFLLPLFLRAPFPPQP